MHFHPIRISVESAFVGKVFCLEIDDHLVAVGVIRPRQATEVDAELDGGCVIVQRNMDIGSFEEFLIARA